MALPTSNWHWKNKSVTPWAKDWFERELVNISVAGENSEVVTIEDVTEFEGDVELGQRKSKLITIYDCKIELKWTGVASDGTQVSGMLTVPEVSHEITLDGLSDYVYLWKIDTAPSPAVDALFAFAKARLPVALETKFAEFPVVLMDVHAKDLKDLNASNEPSRVSTPTPTSGTSAAASTLASSSARPAAPASQAPKAAVVNTTTVKVESAFMASAQDLFSLLTDEKRIPQWSKNAAQSSGQPGSPYVMFGGGVKGIFISTSPPSLIVQSWALQSPAWPSGHMATLTTTLEQQSDCTKVIWELAGVPTGSEDEMERNLQGYYVNGLKSIGLGSVL